MARHPTEDAIARHPAKDAIAWHQRFAAWLQANIRPCYDTRQLTSPRPPSTSPPG
jgi:hypothetical protein